MSIFLDDLAAMFDDFGVEVIPSDGDSFAAIFSNEYVGVGEVPVDSAAPTLTCQSADIAAQAVVVGSILEVESAEYAVRSIQPDGTGVSTLVLEAL